MERVVKGIWIPIEIWENPELSLQERCLLAEIDSLDGVEGCYASNERLAKYLQLSKDRVTRLVSSLKEKGFVSVKLIYKPGTKEVLKRIIKVLNKPIGKNTDTLSVETPIPIGENATHPIGENAYYNNTSINNTIESSNALEFLLKNYPFEYENLMMKYQSKISDFEKAKEQFNLQFDVENKNYEVKIITARAQLYFNRWIDNQTKFNQNNYQPQITQQQQVYRKNTF